MVYSTILKQILASVPFAEHVGVVGVDAGPGTARLQLKPRRELLNHVGSFHAAAQFTLAETASGVAMACAMAPVVSSIVPLAGEARIRYLRRAEGTITAEAKVATEGDVLIAQIKRDGKVRFDVEVVLSDEQDQIVSEVTVQWHVRMKQAR
jgi:uncharacterized protein (TIGR00369 family)